MTRKFLFLGGPKDGQWLPVYLSERDAGRRPYRIPVIGGTAIYYPRRFFVPGWRIPLTFYCNHWWGWEPESGQVLPGLVAKQPGERSFTL